MSNGTISIDALEGVINDWTEGFWAPGEIALAILDPVYSIPTLDDVAGFLVSAKQSIGSEDTHNSKIWDCDQYSRYVWVEAGKYVSRLDSPHKWPLGIMSGYFTWIGDGIAHTCNWVYMGKDGFSLIEPQGLKPHDFDKTNNKIEVFKKSIRLIIV